MLYVLGCVGLSRRLTLQADYTHSLGISIATVSGNMSAAELANITEEVLSVPTLNDPQIFFNNTASSWLNVSSP